MKLKYLWMILFLIYHSPEAYSAQFPISLKKIEEFFSLDDRAPKVHNRAVFPFSILGWTYLTYVYPDVAVCGGRESGILRFSAIILGRYDHQYNGNNPPLEILLDEKFLVDTTKDIEAQLKHFGCTIPYTYRNKEFYPWRSYSEKAHPLPKGTICIKSDALEVYKYRGKLIALVIKDPDQDSHKVAIRKKGESLFYPLTLYGKRGVVKLFGRPESIEIKSPSL